MARFKDPAQPDFHRLKSILAQTKQTENPLYQTVEELLDKLRDYQKITNDSIAAAATTGGVPGPPGPPGPAAGPHHLTHEPGGSDPMAVDAATTTGSLRTLGTGSNQAAAGNDPRFTNSRPPTSHHTTHEPGGIDALVNAAWTNVNNQFTADQRLTKASPKIDTVDSSGPVNGKSWRVSVTNQGYSIVPWNDNFVTQNNAGFQVNPDGGGNFTGGVYAYSLQAGSITATGDLGNVAVKDRSNTFTGVRQVFAQSAPQLVMTEQAQPANQRVFDIVVNGQRFAIRALDDAYSTALSIPLSLDRIGNAFISADIYEKSRTLPIGHYRFDDCISYCQQGMTGPFSWALIGKTLFITLFGAGTGAGGLNVSRFNMPIGVIPHNIVVPAMVNCGVWEPGFLFGQAGQVYFDILRQGGSALYPVGVVSTVACSIAIPFA